MRASRTEPFLGIVVRIRNAKPLSTPSPGSSSPIAKYCGAPDPDMEIEAP